MDDKDIIVNNMDLNGIEYLGFLRIMDRGTADIIEQSEDVLFFHDTVSEVNFLACEDDELARSVLDRHSDRELVLITTPNKAAAEYARDKFGYEDFLECYQYAYYGEMPEQDPRLTLRIADQSDLPAITEVYDLISAEEIAKVIDRGSVIMAYDGEKLVGFIGEHLEGSMGMLFIFPEHRLKGYALALERAGIKRSLDKGLIPFGQVETDNYPSLELQKRIGMTVADRPVYWTW